MKENIDKAVGVCLNPQCQQATRYILDMTKRHNPHCSKYIFTIQSLLNSNNHQVHYPLTQLGQIVKKKLDQCKKYQKQGYLDIILDDFKQTINNLLQNVKQELSSVYPLNHLEKCYKEIYSLEPIQTLLKQKASSSLISQQIKLMASGKRMSRLLESNSLLDDVNIKLNQIVSELSVLITDFKMSVIQAKKNMSDKTRQFLGKNFTTDEVIYGVSRTNYSGGSNITFQGGWIIFPQCSQDSFKPWVYSQKGFSSGIHKLKIICSKPSKSTNCGLAVIRESDIDSYPYSNYKSLYDRVTREFKLSAGQQIHNFINDLTEMYLIMDFNSKKIILYDGNKRCQYTSSLKDSTIYYFAIVGENWKVRVLHLS